MHLWLARRTNNAAGVSSVVAHRGPAQRFRAACDLGTGRRLPRVTALTLTHNLSELGHDPVCRFSVSSPCRMRSAHDADSSLASCCLAALSAGMPLDAMQGSATKTMIFQKVALWLWTCRWSHRHTWLVELWALCKRAEPDGDAVMLGSGPLGARRWSWIDIVLCATHTEDFTDWPAPASHSLERGPASLQGPTRRMTVRLSKCKPRLVWAQFQRTE